jgi:ribosomal protein S27AE
MAAIRIITAFLKQAQPKHECILLFNALFEDNISQLLSLYSQYVDAKNLHIWHGLGPTEARNTNNQDNKKISVLLREKYIEKLAPDIVFMPTFFEGFGDNTVLSMPKNRHYQIFATTHDLIPLVQKSLYLDPQPVFKEYYLDQVKTFKTADGFCAVSEASKRELIEYLNVDESKVISTSEGIEEQFKNSHPSVQKINKILGTDINETGSLDMTPLSIACKKGNVSLAKYLIEKCPECGGVLVEKKDKIKCLSCDYEK